MRNNLTTLLIVTLATGVFAQIDDPIPDGIPSAEVTIRLESFVKLPTTSGGGRGDARIGVMRSSSDGRLFVNDQRGYLFEIAKGSRTLFMNFRKYFPDFIDEPGLGTGMHSFALHPEFVTNGRFYTVHSEPGDSGTPDFIGPVSPQNEEGQMSVVTEWVADDPSASRFSGTQRELFRVFFLDHKHCIQELAFNPGAIPDEEDYGLLYITMGEGASYLFGLWENEQRLDSPMGTVFRIDPLANNSANGQYGIPETNPFADSSDESVLKEIYAYGFRNPHRITFDTGGTGRMYIGDIGEKNIEEINLLEPGGNYGFPQREGTFVLDPTKPEENTLIYDLPPDDDTFGFLYPVVQYDHDEGFAIVNGPVYRSETAPLLQGILFFGDISNGRVFGVDEASLAQGTQADFLEYSFTLDGKLGDMASFVGERRADLRFGMDGDGDVYLMSKTNGQIMRIIGATEAVDPSDYDPDKWELWADFSTPGKEVADRETVKTVADPFGDGANRVLASWFNSKVFQLTGQPDPGTVFEPNCSLYIRFALGEIGSEAKFSVESYSGGFFPGEVIDKLVAVFSGDGTIMLIPWTEDPVIIEGILRPGVWYEAWFLINNATTDESSYSMYLRGDRMTKPILIADDIVPGGGPLNLPDGSTNARAFIWGVTHDSEVGAKVYLDDFHVDPTGHNLSSPLGPNWAVVSDFENDGTLFEIPDPQDGIYESGWGRVIADNTGIFSATPDAFTYVTEMNGNSALYFSPSAIEQSTTVVVTRLPHRIEVGDEVTFYGRAKIVDASAWQAFGLVNVPPHDIERDVWNSYGPMSKFSDELGELDWIIRDGSAYQYSDGEYPVGAWREFWMHVNNGTLDSGGQTSTVYMREDGRSNTPVMVYENALFRDAREAPMDVFMILGDTWTGRPGAVLFDDLYLIDGYTLDRPSGTGYGMYPSRRGWKENAWLGTVWDESFPWVFSESHGWWFAAGNDPQANWHFDSQLGWLWIAPDSYPYLYSATRVEWVYSLEVDGESRWFYGLTAKGWFSAPRNM